MSKKTNNTNDLDTLDNIIVTENDHSKLIYFDDILPHINQQPQDDKTIILNDKNESVGNKTSILEGEVMSKEIKKRNSKKNKKKKIPWKKKNKKQKAILISKIIAIILFLLGILGIIFCAMFYKSVYDKTIDVTPQNFFKNQSSVNIYDRNNNLIGSLSEMNIDWISIKDEAGGYNISENYLNALISIEDDQFYSHKGINIVGLAKATVLTLFTDNDRGGSTLTMQIAKLLYMNDWLKYDENGENEVSKRPLEYKVTQMAYARKIEQQFTKDEILESYVNSIYFGEGGYGIKNASLYYFGVEPKDLTIAQGAVLAGMTQLPSTYNPYKDPALVTERRNQVLGRMLELEKITKAEYDEAMATDLTLSLVPADSHVVDTTRKYTAYLDVVYQELMAIFDPNKTGEFNPATAGMNIYTNMDPKLQIDVWDAINNNDPSFWNDDVITTGVAQIDTKTGGILSIGNGRNGHDGIGGSNYAYNTPRQPGSTAKPIMDYGPAVEYLGWSNAHRLVDEPISYDGGSEVFNHDKTYQGEMTMQKALASSRNTTALFAFKEVAKTVGLDKIMNFAQNLGIKDVDNETFNQAYSLGGWTYGTTPVELAGAYAAFGNGGTYNEPKAIKKIELSPSSPFYEKFGDTYEVTPKTNTAMKPSTAFVMTEMMDLTNPEAQGSADRAYVSGYGQQSGKTGTSNWSDNPYGIPDGSQRDKWLVNYTANVTTATWTGYEPEYEMQGYYIPYGVQKEGVVMREILKNMPSYKDDYLTDDSWSKPADVDEIELNNKVDPSKGHLNYWPFSKLVNGEKYWFIKGSADAAEVKEDFSTTAAPAPTVTNKKTDKAFELTWDYTGADRDRSSWNVYVDGKLLRNVTSTSTSITFVEMSKLTSCKTDYEISIELQETNDKGVTRKSALSKINVKLENTNFCDTNTTPTPPTTEEPTDPPTTETPPTTESRSIGRKLLGLLKIKQ